jgi:hypothetical protein
MPTTISLARMPSFSRYWPPQSAVGCHQRQLHALRDGNQASICKLFGGVAVERYLELQLVGIELGEVGPSTMLAGYSLVDAANLEAATALASKSPSVNQGGGVEVGMLIDLPA